jgi:hypothetical protein
MEIQSIIGSINKLLPKIDFAYKGNFILKQTITPNKTFKAFKTLIVELWFYHKEIKQAEKVYTVMTSNKITEDNIHTEFEALYSTMLNHIIRIIKFNTFDCGDED